MRVERALVGLFLTIALAAVGCSGGNLAYNLPPSERIMHPGPGVGGPGPGVIPPAGGYGGPGAYGPGIGRFGDASGGGGGVMMGGAVCATESNAPMAESPIMQASYVDYGGGGVCTTGCCGPSAACGPESCGPGGGLLRGLFAQHGNFGAMATSYDGGMAIGMGATSQIAFLGDEGIQVQWDVSGVGMFDSAALVIPGRQNFYQGAIYRLRVSNIPGRPEATLYPTLEVAPVTPRTDAYLAHSPIPVQFTQEDFDQVLSGNYVTKVIYLPDPEFQELALAGVETLVSTRLDPGVDPIVEADRRGSILAILRMGNKDLEPGVSSGGVQMGPGMYEPTVIEPMSYDSSMQGAQNSGRATTAEYDYPIDGETGAIDQADYCYGGSSGGMVDTVSGTMPMGMPTAGFAPPAVPPHMIAGGPTWGMPMSGTPIGLPGPPHIPLGSPAGLQKHMMHNRTRVHIPPPVAKMNMSVKQRPGMNYPRPVTHVHVDENGREPFRLWPFGNPFHGRAGRHFSNGTPTGAAAGYGPGGIPCE